MTFEIENNHANKAVLGFAMPFWGKPRWAALMVAIANEIQAVENALFDALVLRQLPNATGIRLRVLARVVGQPVKDYDDPTLRRLISVRIAVNRSEGRWDDLVRILQLWGVTSFDLTDSFPAGLRLDIEDVRTDSALLAQTIVPAKVAGVSLRVIGPPAGGAAASGFMFSDSVVGTSDSTKGFDDSVSVTRVGGFFSTVYA